MDQAENNTGLRESILSKLSAKAALTQKVYDNTFAVFNSLKELLHEMSSEISDALEERGRRVRIEYRDRGKFEAQLQVADDILIFSMHTDVFEFNREHIIWQNPYIKNDTSASYCGIISIYNFLSDSFKYNRMSDEGYLIARIFVNREMEYFAEGKRQESMRHDKFGTGKIDRDALTRIIEAAVDYSVDFDLLVPRYDSVKVITADQLTTKLENSKMVTGKRLGYEFNSDDV